ncbi:YwqI/YxiC family protein [Bacillus sp. FSL K6-0047]
MPEIKIDEGSVLSALSETGEQSSYSVSDHEPAIHTSSMAFLHSLLEVESGYADQFNRYLDVVKNVQAETKELVQTYGVVDKMLASRR